MSQIKDKLWSIEPHTEMKHTILRKYLDVWIPILNSKKSDLIYIDGFAGPGEYSNGEKGSPIIALEALKNQRVQIKKKVNFVFIEKDQQRCDHLIEVLKKFGTIESGYIKDPICGEFETEVNKLLDNIDESIERKKEETGRSYFRVPTFAFIDPFGYQMRMETVKRIMSSPQSEVLITFVIPELKRFCNNLSWENMMTNLFGSDEWKKINNIPVEEKDDFLRDLYIKQLKEYAEIKYVLSFQMINKHNQTSYFLLFGTNHWRGLEEMKNKLWKVDPTGDFKFNDITNPVQHTLMDYSDFNYEKIISELKKLSGKEITVMDIRKYITLETPYPTQRIKSEVLKKMEINGDLIGLDPRKKANSYPGDYFKVKFT